MKKIPYPGCNPCKDGIVFINGDDAILNKHKSELRHRIITFGLGNDNDYFATNIKVKTVVLILPLI